MLVQREDLTGQTFNRLTAIRWVSRENGHQQWLWQCECGESTFALAIHVKRGHTKSCGCYRRRWGKKYVRTHKAKVSGQPEYETWGGLKQRCYNSKNQGYANYGGRGILICERWLDSFENFLADMGKRPTPKHSIERINNDGHYEPSNCRWATMKEQNRNKRDNKLLTFEGQTMCVSDWAAHLNVPRPRLQSRLYYGWTVERALTQPARPRQRKS